jgi:DNA/RNA-binding domain of Phe-tRNA-synthetase-like protein
MDLNKFLKRVKTMRVIIDQNVRRDFPELMVLATIIRDLRIVKEDPLLESLKDEVIREIRSKYDTESLKYVPSVRAYRDFFWKIGIDPTKSRPAAEALIRRILLGNQLPKINTFVDSLNLASVKSGIAIGSFDTNRIIGELVTIRYAVKGESFHGIGMDKPITLCGREVVLSDDAGLIAIYPYRDSERTKITETTQNALLIFCGVPGVGLDTLREAMNLAVNLITRFCGGFSMLVEVE